jgi:uncharacterized membrane protein (UPF0127 family)
MPEIVNITRPLAESLYLPVASTFFQRLIGLMFRKSINPDGGLLFVGRKESISGSSIHMRFCFMQLGIVWADRDKRVVDKTLATPWEFNRHPSRPAMYILEVHPSRLEEFQPGDQLSFRDTAPALL